MSDLKELSITDDLKTVVAPKLVCINCSEFYRGQVRYCPNRHGVCSMCLPEDEKRCPVEGCGRETIIALDFLSDLVKDLRLPVPCRYGEGASISDVRAAKGGWWKCKQQH